MLKMTCVKELNKQRNVSIRPPPAQQTDDEYRKKHSLY